MPGQTQFTVTRRAYSIAASFVRWTTAARVARFDGRLWSADEADQGCRCDNPAHAILALPACLMPYELPWRVAIANELLERLLDDRCEVEYKR